MKRKLFLSLLVLGLLLTGCSKKEETSLADQALVEADGYLEQNDYFKALESYELSMEKGYKGERLEELKEKIRDLTLYLEFKNRSETDLQGAKIGLEKLMKETRLDNLRKDIERDLASLREEKQEELETDQEQVEEVIEEAESRDQAAELLAEELLYDEFRKVDQMEGLELVINYLPEDNLVENGQTFYAYIVASEATERLVGSYRVNPKTGEIREYEKEF